MRRGSGRSVQLATYLDFQPAGAGRGAGSSLGSAAGLPHLLEAMAKAGYGRDLIERIAWRNWLSVLRRTWGA